MSPPYPSLRRSAPSRQNPAALRAAKYVGTGNDFLFLDARAGGCRVEPPRPELARRLCDRHFGVGSDGVVFVESTERERRLKWDFYNSDGSPAEMCGNAARCMGRWAEVNCGWSDLELETQAGLIHLTVFPERVTSRLDFVNTQSRTIQYRVRGQTKTAESLNTGVPHVVVKVESLENVLDGRYQEDIEALRFHSAFGPAGTNVTFLEVLNERTTVTGGDGAALVGISGATVTFERGVEGLTLSCGTGVLAAAAVALSDGPGVHARLQTPGGELEVTLLSPARGIVLSGPAQYLFDVCLTEEFVR